MKWVFLIKSKSFKIRLLKTTKEIIENNKRNKWKQQKKSPPLLFLLFVMPPPQAGCPEQTSCDGMFKET